MGDEQDVTSWELEIVEMMQDHSKIKGCTLEVDLSYPDELRDYHNDYPLAPENVTVNGKKAYT